MIQLQSDLALRGRLTVQEWAAPIGAALWVPSPGGGSIRQQLQSAGFRLVDEQRTPNEVLNTGRNLLRDFLTGAAVTGINRYAVGTDGTLPDRVAQAGLLAEVWRGAISSFTPDVAKVTLEAFLPSGFANGVTLQEAGPYAGADDTAGSGTCYARAVFTPRPKTNQKALLFNHDLYLGA